MSRLYIFPVAVFLALSCTGKTVVDTPEGSQDGTGKGFTLTVATFNVLKPKGRRTEMSMDSVNVSQALARSVTEAKADIIGFNELDETLTKTGWYSLSASCKSIINYTWSLEWPNDVHESTPPGYSYANGFAYNNKKLKLEESGYVWLSKEDDAWYVKPSSAYLRSGSPERTCIWARMTHIASKKEFWLFVTHLPTSSQGGAYNMAGVVNRYAAQKAGDAPAILTGDMNSAPGSAAYRRLISFWKDGNTASWGTLSGSSTNYYYPVDQFTRDRSDRRIDHIMTRGCTASDYHTVVVTYIADGQAWCPSDHLPVAATIKFD